MLLHTLAAFVLLRLFLHLGLRPSLAYLATLPFLLHPVVAESVSWVSSRKDILAALFCFLALLQGRKALLLGRGQFLVCCLVLLACYSKGSALVFPVLAFLLWRRPVLADARLGSFRKLWLWTTAICLLAAVHQAFLAMGAAVAQLPARPLALPGTFLHYLRVLAWPLDLAVHYPREATLDSFAASFGSKAVLLLLLGVSAILLLRKQRSAEVWIGTGLLLILASLLPYNNVLPATSLPAADRYLYLALAGLGLFVVGLTTLFPERLAQRTSFALLIALPLLFIPASYRRAKVFKNSQTLWEANLAVFPDDAVSLYNLGRFHLVNEAGLGEDRGKELLLKGLRKARLPVHRLRIAQLLYHWTRGMGDYEEAFAHAETLVSTAERLAGRRRLQRIAMAMQLAQAARDAKKEFSNSRRICPMPWVSRPSMNSAKCVRSASRSRTSPRRAWRVHRRWSTERS